MYLYELNVKFVMILTNRIKASLQWIFPLKSPQDKPLMAVGPAKTVEVEHIEVCV